jgi:lipoprotein-releasing system permease protein
VNVVQRYNDISILKTVGFTPKEIMRLFSFQGVMIGVLGLIGGFFLGSILCLLFSWFQQSLSLVSGSVYKIEGIHLQIRFIDSIAICAVTLIICFLATLVPARRGSQLSPVEGLRYG